MPTAYQTLIMSAIKNELASFYSYTQSGAVKAYGYLFEGSCELLDSTEKMEKVQGMLQDFVHYSKNDLVDQLDLELASLLVETLQRVLQVCIDKEEKGICCKNLI